MISADDCSYADVILPLALPELFTYAVPENLRDGIRRGQRVVVQFGRQRVYAALVFSLHNQPPSNYTTKEILSVIDDQPIVNDEQFRLWQWISDYYIALPGEVMSAALPSALRLQSESVIVPNEEFDGDASALTDREYLIYEALQLKPELTISDISKILSIKFVMPVLRNLVKKKVVLVLETLDDKYKPRYVEMVSLHPDMGNDDKAVEAVIASIEKKAPKQVDLLLAFYQHTRELGQSDVVKSYLLKKAQVASSVLAALEKKKVLQVTSVQADRLPVYNGDVVPPKSLSPDQDQALTDIRQAFDNKKVTLLHGVTSSGKTELYIHLIEDKLRENKQVLYLLPEIALTTQIIRRLQRHFGNKLLVYHSRFNENERVEVWNKILDDNLSDSSARIVIGARSSVFLPFSKLGLVIVDEEHDHSYKQDDPSPRYNGRDVAVVLANQQDADVLLGSATPCLESYFNALSGKYALVNLNKRHAGLEMPEVELVDLKRAVKRKEMNGNFSARLIERITEVLANGHQVILFQNRRGFAPFLECNACSWVPTCLNCDVSLTYHKVKNELRCHYCGYVASIPVKCGTCGEHDIRMRGFGTERIEEDLKILLPDVKIGRLDHDTTRSKMGYQRILGEFEEGNIDILVGTQMVTKGLDFDRVNLVGILNADSMLHFPDFRSYERGFQLMSQVSGRAGRKNQTGSVLLQTYDPGNWVLQHVIRHDFKGFYEKELVERYKFGFPPYTRLIELRLKHKDPYKIDKSADALTKELKKTFGKRVLGPTIPTVMRIRNYYLRTVLLKLEKTLSVADVKRKLTKSISDFKKNPDHHQLIVQVDVDPV
jgi:primosomal protein N' (replication factor Y) (superfamily II helicase)